MDTPNSQPADFDEALQLFGGDRNYMNELFAEYADGLPRRVEEIRAALQEGSAELLFKRAHSLKGVSLSFCAHPLVEAARQIEEAGRNGDMSNMPALTAKLEEEARRLLEYLAENLPR